MYSLAHKYFLNSPISFNSRVFTSSVILSSSPQNYFILVLYSYILCCYNKTPEASKHKDRRSFSLELLMFQGRAVGRIQMFRCIITMVGVYVKGKDMLTFKKPQRIFKDHAQAFIMSQSLKNYQGAYENHLYPFDGLAVSSKC